MSAPQRLTTAQLKAMISGGATREELPSKLGTTGLTGSASSTTDSAQKEYLRLMQRYTKAQKIEETRALESQYGVSMARINQQQRTEDLKIQAAQRAQAELDKQARMITVSNNSKNLPNYTAQNQRDFSDTTKYIVHGNNNRVSNNNVIANDVWSDPNVTVTGQSKTSKPSSSSIAANENYNTATAMNDFMSANPSSDINMGSANPQPTIWWKSAAPQDNSVQTSDLGGDIQHIETDSNTNVEYLPLQNKVPSDTNWADKFGQNISLGTVGVGLAAIGILLQLGKKN